MEPELKSILSMLGDFYFYRGSLQLRFISIAHDLLAQYIVVDVSYLGLAIRHYHNSTAA